MRTQRSRSNKSRVVLRKLLTVFILDNNLLIVVEKSYSANDHSKFEKKSGKGEKGEGVKFNQLNKLYNELMLRKVSKDARPKKVVVDDVIRMTSGIMAQVQYLPQSA